MGDAREFFRISTSPTDSPVEKQSRESFDLKFDQHGTELPALAKIDDAEYFHGLLPREDIQYLLRQKGDFLVRLSETVPNQPRHIILSVMVGTESGSVRHVVIQFRHGKFCTDMKKQFNNVADLILFYMTNKQTVFSSIKNAILIRPVSRAPWELQHSDIVLQSKIGEGAYGEVHSGSYKIPQTGEVVPVAIKVAKTTEMNKEKIKEMMKEARMMRNFVHHNIVRMYGVCVEREPLLIVMELVEGGALDDYLKKIHTGTTEKIENMILGSAWGLEYLHSQNCIHMDVAARNCLYSQKRVVKLSDFGLSHEGLHYQCKRPRRVPIKWLAPETIQALLYSSKTDVWSFGVMSWEILSNAKDPYEGLNNAQVKEKVTSGYKMPLPSETPRWLVELIQYSCWDLDPSKRYNMAQIARSIELNTGIRSPYQPGSLPKVEVVVPKSKLRRGSAELAGKRSKHRRSMRRRW